MAAKILLVLLFVITVAEAAPLPVEWAAANKSISDAREKMRKAFDEVNAATTPDKKKRSPGCHNGAVTAGYCHSR